MADTDGGVDADDAGLTMGAAGAPAARVVKCSTDDDCKTAQDRLGPGGTRCNLDVVCLDGRCLCAHVDDEAPCQVFGNCPAGEACSQPTECNSRQCEAETCVGNDPNTNAPNSGGCAGCTVSHAGHASALVLAAVVVAVALGRRLRSLQARPFPVGQSTFSE